MNNENEKFMDDIEAELQLEDAMDRYYGALDIQRRYEARLNQHRKIEYITQKIANDIGVIYNDEQADIVYQVINKLGLLYQIDDLMHEVKDNASIRK